MHVLIVPSLHVDPNWNIYKMIFYVPFVDACQSTESLNTLRKILNLRCKLSASKT